MSVALTKRFAPTLANQHVVILFYAIATVLALYPLLAVNIPPLTDYLAHLARMHIISSIGQNAHLQANYEVSWRLIPNLGMDLLASPLVALAGVYGAGKFFIALAILTPVAGVAALRKVLYGRVGYAPALAFFPAYNFCLAWGFLNFLFAVGLSLLAYAGWIASRDMRLISRIAFFAAVSMIIYLGHLFAFATYALLVALDTFIQLLRNRHRPARSLALTIIAGGAQFVVPGALMFAAMLAGSGGYAEYGALEGKLRVLVTPFYSAGTPADLLLVILTVSVVVWAAIARRLTVAPQMRAPLLLLLATAIAMPVWLMQTWLVDIRMPVVLAFAAIASTRLRLEPGLGTTILLTFVGLLFVGRVLSIEERWAAMDRDLSEFRAALTVIPEGSKVFSVQPLTEDQVERAGSFPQAYWGLPSLAVIERAAFVPTLFTDPEKQILNAAPRNMIVDTPFGRPPTLEEVSQGAGHAARGALPLRHYTGKYAFWTDWPHRFDYAIMLFVQPPAKGVGELLKPVHVGSYFTIYRIIPGSCDFPPSEIDSPGQPTCIRDNRGTREINQS